MTSPHLPPALRHIRKFMGVADTDELTDARGERTEIAADRPTRRAMTLSAAGLATGLSAKLAPAAVSGTLVISAYRATLLA